MGTSRRGHGPNATVARAERLLDQAARWMTTWVERSAHGLQQRLAALDLPPQIEPPALGGRDHRVGGSVGDPRPGKPPPSDTLASDTPGSDRG